MPTEIIAIQGDITKMAEDAIVNAANKSLTSGVGVNGAIHSAAGPELLKECESLGGCRTGQAKITKGYNLPAKYVIHTVGPVYGSGDGNEDEQLADCYRNSLNLVLEHNLATIAFANISTGIFRYPKDEAVEIAVNTVWQWVKDHPYYNLKKITFVCFTKTDYKIYKNYLDKFNFA